MAPLPKDKSDTRETRDRQSAASQSSPARSSALKASIDWTIVKLILMSIAVSAVLAGYVLAVGRFTNHRQANDRIGESALYTARRLAQIFVERPAFGRIGICDLESDQVEGRLVDTFKRPRIIGLNTVRRLLAADRSIAERLKSPMMLKLVFDDVTECQRIEEELSTKMRQAVDSDLIDPAGDQPGQDPEHNNQTDQSNQSERLNVNRVYKDVYRMLANDNSLPNYVLNEVHIKLGRLDVPDWPEGNIRLIDAHQFVSCERSFAPYAVLIEAIYQLKPNAPHKLDRRAVRRSCAVIASNYADPEPSALVLNFPDGMPKLFTSVAEILRYSSWTGQGDWQQASNEVPGKGSLEPPLQPVLPGMSAGDALSVALYHWLRHAGPNISPDKVVRMLNYPISENQVPTASPTSLPTDVGRVPVDNLNSCLAIDTGAREYSIMNQTAQGGAGQLALGRLFNVYTPGLGSSIASGFPPSAVPLFVDSDGKVNLPATLGFDSELIRTYLKDLYDTNLAAVESLSVSKMAMARAETGLAQLNQKLFIERQELNSLQNRLIRTGGMEKQPQKEPQKEPQNEGKIEAQEEDKQTVLARQKIAALTKTIDQDLAERDRLDQARTLSLVTSHNATRVATTTFELCSHAQKVCKEGIVRTDQKNRRSYIIARKFLFTPQPDPTDESDFFRPEYKMASAEEAESLKQPFWFTRSVDVIENVNGLPPKKQQAISVDGVPLTTFLNSTPPRQKSQPVVVLLNSQRLLTDGPPVPAVPTLMAYSPYGGIAIPSGQLFYYCQNSLTTGSEPKASWSVAIRDLVAVKNAEQGREVGEPPSAATEDWYKPTMREGAPGLAGEFQLRSPLPILPRQLAGSYLTNPLTNIQVPEVPPVPPEML